MWKIITGFFSWVFSPIISVLDFPILPEAVVSAIHEWFSFMLQGIELLNFFVPIFQIVPAITIFLSVWTVKHGYDMVMWILGKIPFIGVK